MTVLFESLQVHEALFKSLILKTGEKINKLRVHSCATSASRVNMNDQKLLHESQKLNHKST